MSSIVLRKKDGQEPFVYKLGVVLEFTQIRGHFEKFMGKCIMKKLCLDFKIPYAKKLLFLLNIEFLKLPSTKCSFLHTAKFSSHYLYLVADSSCIIQSDMG